jgi:hypothetical protein
VRQLAGGVSEARSEYRRWKKKRREQEQMQPTWTQTAGGSRLHVWNAVIIARDGWWPVHKEVLSCQFSVKRAVRDFSEN